MTAQQWISIVSGRMRGLSVLFRSYRGDFLNRMRRDEMGEEEICDAASLKGTIDSLEGHFTVDTEKEQFGVESKLLEEQDQEEGEGEGEEEEEEEKTLFALDEETEERLRGRLQVEIYAEEKDSSGNRGTSTETAAVCLQSAFGFACRQVDLGFKDFCQRRNEDDLLPLPLPSTMRTHCKDPVCREGCCLPLPMPMLTDDVSLQEEGKILRVETIFTSSGRDEGRVAARVFI
ncbi:hypothetical protein HZH66_012501 [Vespula vulgaris]|uniref:Uncharacterized protein n=1 Tax=Vespula vulgaris TaxID=7454 RepID=A0A834JAZ7_VESVU|nr:hypothetical protein HZH66_012501 [Vespula vulgaris]